MRPLPTRVSRFLADLRAFARHLLRAVPVIAAVTIATTAAHHFHLLDSFEFAALDAYLASLDPHAAGHVVIVTITDDDYRDMFEGRSPLPAGKLRELVDAILDRRPAALGVDIVTPEAEHAEAFQGFTRPGVVWVQDAWNDTAAGGQEHSEPRWKLDKVLGREDAAGVKTGLSVFPLDPDRVVRRYYRQIAFEGDGGAVTRPSLAASILATYCASRATPECERVRRAPDEEASDARWFNFAGDRYSFRKIPARAVGEAPVDLFKDAIVLLGGTYSAARDVHATSLGEMSGVELTAFAIESELGGGGVTASNAWLMVAAELLSAVVLVWLNWRWPASSRTLALVNGVAIVALAFAGSYLAFSRLGYWASFVPIGAGVWIHQLHERAEAAAHGRRELAEYRRRFGPLLPALLLLVVPSTGAGGHLGADQAGVPAQSLTIAAASDLRSAMPKIVEAFERTAKQDVTVTFGASGNFFSQIQNGAPFDLFFSADIEYPRRLEAEGLVERGSVSRYAVGRIVLWTRTASGVDVQRGLPALLDAGVRRIAIANPATAPYGRAAVAALRHEQLHERVRAKLVFGENVSQAAQFVDSGNADAGIIAESLALDPALRDRGVYYEIPSSFHPAIEQAVGVVQSSSRKRAAHAFVAFLRTPEIIGLMERYGFTNSPAAGEAR